ncbi:MAG: ATP-dependent helicase HrpB [Pseudomonadota bacterium]
MAAVLPELIAALRAKGQAVLQAPPGAGKTTGVPLALLEAGWIDGRIVVLEPRRLAARAAAERMAQMRGEAVGQSVGYRIRGESRVSRATRIDVVTEGILTRMLQSDPGLDGVGAVLFDEFHERSLNADLGLALALEARAALRDDLVLLPMSATLDAAPVAELMGGAPVITAEGRSYPVDLVHRAAPLGDASLERAVADTVCVALAEIAGSVLVFLPGEREIRRVSNLLDGRIGDVDIRPLYGALPFEEQRAAVAPAPSGRRKVVLATAIAETSLTIEGIEAVVDAGQARRARFDARSGMSRLVTDKVSRAEATQRAGRAGRLGPGRCYRLWTKGEEGALAAFPPAEIEVADLAPLALELALWGDPKGTGLAFLTPPPAGPLSEARSLLETLGAVGREGRITDHGRALAALPVHPRLGHMLLRAGRAAAPLAALLSDRDPLRGAPSDLTLRLRALAAPRDLSAQAGALRRIRTEARRLARMVPDAPRMSPAEAAALAYPDRIGLRRPGQSPRWLLSGGKGATMSTEDPLAGQRLLVATDLDGDGREARIRLAVALTEADLRGLFAAQITWRERAVWSSRERRVEARRQEVFGALILQDQHWRDAPSEAVAAAALEGVRALGLPWTAAAARLRIRAELYRAAGGAIADCSEEALLREAETWLLPALIGVRTAQDIRALDVTDALRTRIGWTALQRLEAEMPSQFTTPLGRTLPIDYSGHVPAISARVQELFGTERHPLVGPNKVPIQVTLLSPAGRPVQVTTDLPGFWSGSYRDVAKDMRARYPKHPWPDDPQSADPTLRAKRRSPRA